MDVFSMNELEVILYHIICWLMGNIVKV